MRHAARVVVILAVLSLPSWSTEASVSGNEWLQLDERAQSMYVAGALDAWSTIVTQLAKKQLTNEIGYRVMSSVVTCTSSRALTTKQILAAVQRYVRANPEMRQSDMADLVFASLRDVCKKAGA
jgi:hypothetical protein